MTLHTKLEIEIESGIVELDLLDKYLTTML
jgi:hypothetical protein